MLENLKGRVYYKPRNNKYENSIKEYWEKNKYYYTNKMSYKLFK